jgi:hypothetical protein
MGAGNPHTRKAWTHALTDHAEGMSIGIIHAVGVVRNDTMVGTITGGAAATFSFEGSEAVKLTWPLGRELLQFDADVMALARSAEALAMLFTEDNPPPDLLYLLSPSTSALQAVKNPRSKLASKAALMFHQSLTTITLRHSYVRYHLVWTPLDEELEGQKEARTRALEASRIDPPDGYNRVQSAAFQKKRARDNAYFRWSQEWYLARAKNKLQLSATGLPLDGHAHTHAILAPPDGRNHPLWSKAVDCERDNKGRRIPSRPLYTRRTTSTTIQLAVDHAFTGSYAKRFRPSDPLESQGCPCGRGLRTPTHIILHCARHMQHRLNAAISGHYSPLPFNRLFTTKKGAERLLNFIQSSHAGTQPETGPPPPPHYVPEPDVPPEPD